MPIDSGQPSKLAYQLFGLKLTAQSRATSLKGASQAAITRQYEPTDSRIKGELHDHIDGKIVNSIEPHNSEKCNYTAYDKDNNIGLVQLWGTREALEDREVTGTILDAAGQFNETDWKNVLNKTIDALQKKVKEDNQGSCLLVNIIHKDTIVTVNLGDSTAYLVVIDANDSATTTRLNRILHKPSVKEEYERLTAFAEEKKLNINELVPTGYEGYLQVINNKLGGRLAISGAIGDNRFDALGLRHTPDIYYKKLALAKGARAFVLTACDGLTEPSDMEKVIGKLVAQHKHQTPDVIAKHLGLEALNQGSEDNISVIITPIDLKDEHIKYTAIFDGHGGDRVSEELCKHFHEELNYQAQVRLRLK